MQIRLQKVRDILIRENFNAILISTPANITYLTEFKFAMNEDREGFIVVTPKNQYIISSQLYKDEFLQKASNFEFLEISSATRKSVKEHLKDIVENENIKNLGFEKDNLTFEEYENFASLKIQLSPIILHTLRAVKDEEEIEKIAKACAVGDKAFTYILKQMKEGVSEKQLGFLLDTFIRQNGGEPSFPTIIAFGQNAAVPHHATAEAKLNKNQFVLMDFGVEIDNYCSDMTRTIFFGKPTPKERQFYENVRLAQEKAFDYLKTNPYPISAKKVDAVSRDYVISQGLPPFPHTLGHSIGINVHDGFRLSPISPTLLTEGMCFSVEPGVYISGEIGIRIEDIVALEKNGPRLLTTSQRKLIIL